MAANRNSFVVSVTGLKDSLINGVKAAAAEYLELYPKSSFFSQHASQSQANQLRAESGRIYNYYNTMDESDSRKLGREYLRQLAIWVCEEITILKTKGKTTLHSFLEKKPCRQFEVLLKCYL